jgi:hypothetical protein
MMADDLDRTFGLSRSFMPLKAILFAAASLAPHNLRVRFFAFPTPNFQKRNIPTPKAPQPVVGWNQTEGQSGVKCATPAANRFAAEKNLSGGGNKHLKPGRGKARLAQCTRQQKEKSLDNNNKTRPATGLPVIACFTGYPPESRGRYWIASATCCTSM